jgi:L-cysteine/cystine lyase
MTRYLDLTSKLAGEIADGTRTAGTALPSVRALAAAEHTTSATVARAYRRLADAGVIVRNLPGTPYLRASVGAWNDESDLDRLLGALA